jgi:lysophospholipase L1-like esterase
MRPLAILTALLVGLGAAAAVVVVRTDGPESSRRVGSVTLLGDSLNVGIEPYLADELFGWEIAHHNEVGRTGSGGLAELDRLRDELAPVVVVSLGTNDAQDDVEAFTRLVDDVMRRVGPRRCVVWSTLWLGRPNDSFNDALADATRRHSRLEVADWAGLVEEDDGLLAFDGVHGSPDGYARKAEQIARIAESCHPPAPQEPT